MKKDKSERKKILNQVSKLSKDRYLSKKDLEKIVGGTKDFFDCHTEQEASNWLDKNNYSSDEKSDMMKWWNQVKDRGLL